MKKKTELELYLESIGAKVTPYNSNNAWGFGGAYGNKYVLKDGKVVKIITACYRHLPSEKVITITNAEGKRVFDEINTPKIRAKAVDILKQSVTV